MGVRFVVRSKATTYICGDIPWSIDPKELHPNSSLIFPMNHEVLLLSKHFNQFSIALMNHPEWFQAEQPWSKAYVVNEMINPLVKWLIDQEIITEKDMNMDNEFMIVTPSVIYQVLRDFGVIEITDYASFVLEEQVLYPYFVHIEHDKNIDQQVKNMIFAIMKRHTHLDSQFYQYIYPQGKYIFFKEEDL